MSASLTASVSPLFLSSLHSVRCTTVLRRNAFRHFFKDAVEQLHSSRPAGPQTRLRGVELKFGYVSYKL